MATIKPTQETFLAAKTFAIEHGCDSLRRAGEQHGFYYFHIYNKNTEKHKVGMPIFIKITEMGKPVAVVDFQECMWALKQEVLVNNL